MVTPELVNYIRSEIQRGRNPNEIASSLISHGWSEEDIAAVFTQLGYKTKKAESSGTIPMTSSVSDSRIYPSISIARIENPSRFWAIPVVGGLVKVIILIPVLIWILILFIPVGWGLLFNSFKVLFTGKYWGPSYNLSLGLIRLSAKLTFFFNGLTDKYPGFSLGINDSFTVDIVHPNSSNRLFAIPLLGFLIRLVIAIPFLIYLNIMVYATYVGVYVFSSFAVLFGGKYPESTFELARDVARLNFAWMAYAFGLSDTYPSFRISMNHKVIKLMLIGLAALLYLIFPLIYGFIPNTSKYPSVSQSQYSSQVTNDGLDQNFYVDKQGDFRIRPPRGWRLDESNASLPNFSSRDAQATISVTFESTRGLDFDSYINESKEGLKTLPSYELVEERRTTVNGREAYIIDSRFVQAGSKVRTLQLIVIYNNNAYIVTGGALDQNWNNYKDLIEASMFTLELTGR